MWGYLAAWDDLSYPDRVNALGTALGMGILENLGQEIPGLPGVPGATDTFLQAQVSKILEPIIPVLGAKLLEVAKPAAEKAAEIVGPAIREELNKQIPKFAAITGLVLGLAVVAGIFIAKKVYAH